MYTCTLYPTLLRAAGMVACAALGACEPLAITALGVGGSAAVSHTLNGITYRTFTAPLPRVRVASLHALKRMGMVRKGGQKNGTSETILATASTREIEIELEAVSTTATRMRVIARNGGLFYDSATATELILQTEKALGNG